MAEIFYDKDADISIIQGRKVAVLGFGSQGHAHAANLKESGVNVTVALRKGGASWDKAKSAGHNVLEINEAVKNAEAIFTGGGNTFLLVTELYRNNILDSIEEVINKGIPYLGTSAGSNICGLTMGTTNDMPIAHQGKDRPARK